MIYKTFGNGNVNIRELTVNKSYTFTNNDSGSGVYVTEGVSGSGIFGFDYQASSYTEPINSDGTYKKTVYQSIQHLYYNKVNNPYRNFRNWYGFNSSSLDTKFVLVGIPQRYFGEKMRESSVSITTLNGTFSASIQDDSYGNLYDTSVGTSSYVGNVIYEHGMLICKDTGSYYTSFLSGSTSFTYKSIHTIFEHNYTCEIEPGEFNMTQNVSAISGTDYSQSVFVGYASSSAFLPYITTIGLYNSDRELLAIAKLARPIHMLKNNKLIFNIRIDF